MGVRARLLVAFLSISALSVIGAAAALIAFSEVGAVFDRITRERVPASFAALELARQAERVASFAPLRAFKLASFTKPVFVDYDGGIGANSELRAVIELELTDTGSIGAHALIRCTQPSEAWVPSVNRKRQPKFPSRR